MRIGDIILPDFPLLLAPMEDVSDPPFRSICRENGADLTYSEFISSEGLVHNRQKCRKKLHIIETERPVGIQIFGGDEDSLSKASAIVEQHRPELLDINFGCPVKGIVCKGAGAGVLKDLKLMVRLAEACVRSTSLPVTVKTRLGWDENSIHIEEAAERLQDVGIKALTIHGRTRSQLYKGEADWRLIARVKENPRMHIPVFGNGDINSPQKALEYKKRYGVDGMMIGRASIGYPWIFREIRHYLATGEQHAPPSVAERVAVCRAHLLQAIAYEGMERAVFEMRGRYTAYLKGLPGIRDYIQKLVRLQETGTLMAMLDEVERNYEGFETVHIPVEIRDYHQHYST
ncbi:MAG TPA: tRNA dihydrouridine synthase DusB [Flavisolibacter sp.]|nr:tRNA dihydrouridine synthase DusB [Flavisolibacter sp.]